MCEDMDLIPRTISEHTKDSILGWFFTRRLFYCFYFVQFK